MVHLFPKGVLPYLFSHYLKGILHCPRNRFTSNNVWDAHYPNFNRLNKVRITQMCFKINMIDLWEFSDGQQQTSLQVNETNNPPGLLRILYLNEDHKTQITTCLYTTLNISSSTHWMVQWQACFSLNQCNCCYKDYNKPLRLQQISATAVPIRINH